MRVFFESDAMLGRGRLPTATEMSRIRHTMKMLISNEAVLSDKMASAKVDKDLVLFADIRQHVLEIYWGWGELRSLVDALPESCLDKHGWLVDCIEGRERTAIWYEEVGEQLSGHQISVCGDDISFDGLSI